MNTCFKGLLLSAAGLLIGHQATAASPTQIDTFTCTRSDGSTLKHNVYAFTLEATNSSYRYISVYFLDTVLDTYLIELYFGSGFQECVFGKLPGLLLEQVTIVDVDAAGVGANVGAVQLQQDSVSQAYTNVTFQSTFIQIGANTRTPALPVPSQDEQRKTLAAFKARGLAIPK